MNDTQTSGPQQSPNRKLIVVLMVIIIVLSLLLAVTIPDFIEVRNTAAQRACMNNLRMIDAARQEAAQAYHWGDTLQKQDGTNANHLPEDIGTNAPSLQQ